MNDDSRLNVAVRMLDPDLPLPSYAREDDAGADLSSSQDLVIEPGERALVGTGVSLAIPSGYVGLVHPRSGLAHRHGLSMVNAPGTVDAGYRGEIKVNLLNCDPREPITIRRGDRIAQLVIQKVEHAQFSPVDSLEESERGERGFGSTGVAGLT